VRKAGQGRTVRLAPITLIYGPNSSGKSSLIQSLLLMRQTLTEQGVRGRNDLLTSGSFANLVSFISFIHRHDPARKLKLGFEFAASASRPRRLGSLDQDPCSSLTLSYEATPIPPDEFRPILSGIDFDLVGSDGQSVSFGLQRPAVTTMADLLAQATSTFDDEIDEIEAQAENESGRSQDHPDDFKFTAKSDLSGLYKVAELNGREIHARNPRHATGLPPTTDQQPIKEPSAAALEALAACRFRVMGMGAWGREYIPRNYTQYIGRSADRNLGDFAISGVQDILRDFDNRLRRSVGTLTYLGPLRTHPERLYALQGRPEGSVGAQGEQAVQILYHNTVQSRRDQGADRSRRDRFRVQPTMIDRLNSYCQQFEIPYHFSINSIRSEITGDFVVLSLTDNRTGVSVAPTDVGFGIGQILPILIEGMVAQDQRYPRIVCVEQPEIHLHPRLQAAMADFFIDTAFLLESPVADERRSRRGNVQWILETHSETLVLRLQRRIREGSLSPKDVSILYVNPLGDQGSVIKELELDEEGDFIDEWPDGFFEESFHEKFAGR
jgi:predicted ATPase